MGKQNYEEYWKLTVEYTDINEDNFIGTLKIIVNFIDKHSEENYTSKLFQKLQDEVFEKFPKVDYGSVRKSINQFVKLGFVNFQLKSYHLDAVNFLEATTDRKRKFIFSKIFYTNSSFNRSVTKDSSKREINFLIKTLENVGKLHKSDIEALMLVDIETIDKGYLTLDELILAKQDAQKIDFKIRKYNQVGYLFNFLGKLDDVVFVKKELYFKEDAKRIFGEEIKEDKKVRDPYLHRLYKIQLKEESCNEIQDGVCMVEKLAYPVLIASHIKPFIRCNDNEAYDVNNGILLSKNIDSLFDLGYITFDDSGKILFAEKLDENVRESVSEYKLDKKFLNKKRLEYMNFHRNEVFEKRFKYA